MKNQLRFFITLCILALTTITANAFDYYITFTGSGASTTVDSVVVQNLSKITKVTVPAGMKLRLYDVENAVNDLIAISELAFIYPNPMSGNAIYTFTAKYAGKTQITVFGLDGRKVTGLDADLQQGKNSFQLVLPTGVYLVKVNGNGFSYATKTISLSMNNDPPKITFSGNSTNTKPQRAPAPEVKLQYSAGDQLLYKGYSGNYCTIVTDKPTDTKTTNFHFVECPDADGNLYAVVHIGEQTWMAENLKTTKYRNGDAIPNATMDQMWGTITTGVLCDYNNDVENGTKYGKLYNWYAAKDSRNIAPTGWHVASDAEWTTLENYLIANEYNYDGTTTGNKIAKSLGSTTDWTIHTGIGTIGNNLTKNNSSGFTALPGGSRLNGGPSAGIKNEGYWWSSTEVSTTEAWSRNLSYQYLDNYRGSNQKRSGLSIRCLLGDIPTLTTTIVTDIETTSAVSGGEITNDGNFAVSERGVCWSKSPNPTIAVSKTKNGSGTGSFSSNLIGLSPETTYYVRAYATNSAGTAYGNEVSFTTKQGVAVTDIDGNVYHTVNIGLQTWMVENLKTTRYRNGERISNVTDNSVWAALTTGAWCDYDNNPANGSKYGKLYNWYAVSDSRKIAPEGWHVATDDEWAELQNYLIVNGYNYDGTTTGNKIAKSLAATTDWNTHTGIGAIGNDLAKNNSSGFTALPYGFRDFYGTFFNFGIDGYWWSSTEFDNSKAWFRGLYYNGNSLSSGIDGKSFGLSVRCVKDILAILTTKIVAGIGGTIAVSGGEFTTIGNLAITERGVCWSTIPNPTIKDSKTSDGSGTEPFSSNMTGLSPHTTYYVRAYATSTEGTVYGTEVSFTTNEIVTDIDGNVYNTITIGSQTWMVENLKTTRYRNGVVIGTTSPVNKDISAEDYPSYQWAYNGDESKVAKYGRLYTWFAAISTNIAPEGWHVPSDAEWTELENYLIANGYNYDGTTTENKIAKSLAATTDWTINTDFGAIGNDLSKNNQSYFAALPGGFHFGVSDYLGQEGAWWSTTSGGATSGWSRSLSYNYNNVNKNTNSRKIGFSIRCIKD